MAKNRKNWKDARDDWETPQEFFDVLSKAFKFGVDLAARQSNTKCEVWVDDFLSAVETDHWMEIARSGWSWCNPPYGRTEMVAFVTKIVELQIPTVLLIPSCTGNLWWHELVWPQADLICFVKGRLRFTGAPCAAQFDSALIVYAGGQDVSDEQYGALQQLGQIVWPVTMGSGR